MEIRPGAAVGPYRIVESLGRGGMASVYRAHDPSLDRDVALKILPREFLHDPTFSDRFRREAQVIARLEHPGIVPIYAFDIDRTEGIPWMAMRLVPGGSLAALLRRERPGPARAVAILRGVADALDYAHGKGVVHRDVKPHNVLLDEGGRVYLADFGIAKMLEASSGLTATGTIVGTPQYMAPEQATGTRIDHRADIYALGIMAYELLSGHVPFSGETPVGVLMKQVQEPLPIPPPTVMSPLLIDAVRRAAAKRPDERWTSAGSFVSALEAGLGADTRSHPPAVPTLVSPPTAPARPAPAPTTAMPGALVPSPPTTVTPPPPRLPATSASARPRRRGGLGLGAALALVVGALVVTASVAVVVVGRRGGRPPAPGVGATPAPPFVTSSSVAATPSPPAPSLRSPSADAHPPSPDATATPRPGAHAYGGPARQGGRPPSAMPPPTPAPSRAPAKATPVPAETTDSEAEGGAAARAGGSPHEPPAPPPAPRGGGHAEVPALVEQLASRDATTRWRAAEALGEIGAGAAAAVPDLARALGDADPIVRSEAAKALGLLGSTSVDAVPALAAALRDSQVSVRREAARALALVSPAVEPALAALVAALEDKDRFVRAAAAKALGRMGPKAAAAGPALRKASREKELLVAREARDALRLLGLE